MQLVANMGARNLYCQNFGVVTIALFRKSQERTWYQEGVTAIINTHYTFETGMETEQQVTVTEDWKNDDTCHTAGLGMPAVTWKADHVINELVDS